MARGVRGSNSESEPDDPFQDDDWGPEGITTPSEDMPEGNTDPDKAPFLKPFNLNSREGRLELLSAGPGTEYSDVVLHVKVGRTNYRIGLRTFDSGYIALRKKFGPKRSDWHGPLLFKVKPHKGRTDGYVAVRPA